MSNPVHLSSVRGPWRRLFDTNVAAATAAFVSGGLNGAKLATGIVATPSMAVIDMRGGHGPGAPVCNAIMLRLFGRNTNNQTLSARIWGIEEGIGPVGATTTRTFEATLLAQLQATLSSTATGLDGSSLLGTSDFEADTYSLISGALADVVFANTTDVRGAWVRIDNLGFPQIAVELDDGGSATEINGIYGLVW